MVFLRSFEIFFGFDGDLVGEEFKICDYLLKCALGAQMCVPNAHSRDNQYNIYYIYWFMYQ